MLFEDIKFESNVEVYNDFDLSPEVSMEEQKYSLKEDLYQARFSNGYTIDIGYYPEFSHNGKFWIRIIKDYAWTSPLYSKRTKNLIKLEKCLYECIDIVNALSIK